MFSPDFYPSIAEALGWTLLHSLWQGLVIFLIVSALLRLLRQQSPQLRYLTLCAGLLAMIIWIAATFIHYFPGADTAAMSLSTALPDADIVLTDNAASPAVAMHWMENFQVWLESFIAVYANHLVTVWLLGMLCFALRWTGAFYFTYQLRRQSFQPESAQWTTLLERLADRIDLQRSVQLKESVYIDVPMVIGHLKPVILLPAGTLVGLSPQQLEAVLLHELAHIQRHDYLFNLLLSSLEIVLFYHPLYWWLSDRIAQEREQCCDDIAVANCGNARLYAQTLLLMEEKRQQNTLAMALQGKKHHLLHRIKRICLAPGRPYQRDMSRAGFAMILLCFVAAVAWAQMPVNAQPTISEMNVVEPPSVQDATATTASIVTQSPAQVSHAAEHQPARAATPVQAVATAMPARLVRMDTVPLPAIPQMKTMPKLPEVPQFKADLSKDKLKDAGYRAELRKKIDDYERELEAWREQVDKDYMSHWRTQQDQIRKLYEQWKQDLKREYANDDLQYAIALKRGSEHFEDAIEELEDGIEDAEDEMEDSAEEYLESLEETIQDYEEDMEDEEEDEKEHDKRMAKHRERMQMHSDRMSMHRLRMSAHRSRMDIHRERMSMHRDRMSIHRDKMDAHRTIMAAFKEAFFAQLKKDGLWTEGDKNLEFVIEGGQITVDGKPLSDAQAQPYFKLLRDHGMYLPKGSDVWRYNIDGDRTDMGTRHRKQE